MYAGIFMINKVEGVRFIYHLEILEEEWTKRQEILIIREIKWD